MLPDTPPVTLRPAVETDEAFLLDLYASTREAELALTGWDEPTRQAFVRQQFDAQRRDYAARFPGAEQSVIVCEGAGVGRVWLHRGPSEHRLLDITVAAPERGRGIGACVLQALQQEAGGAGLPLRHMVLAGNAPALRFYARLGFSVVADAGAYLLMEWTAPAATAAERG